MNPRIKRIYHPAFTDLELSQEDPVLGLGEIVYIKNASTGEIDNFKVGDGATAYTALPFKDISSYSHADPVTNQIGDVLLGSTQVDRPLEDIVKDFISPYVAPLVSNVRNQANGVDYQVTTQLEIGQSIGAAVAFTFNVSNPENLVAIPMEVNSSGAFLESNPYPNQSISLSPNGVLAPTSPTVYTIQIRAIHTNGTSVYVDTFIRFDTRFIWGASALADLTTNQHAIDLITNGGGEQVKQGFSGEEFVISTVGYGYVLIPSILAPTSVVWTEISDPNAPASIGMVNMGTLSVNNGVGTYNYDKFRTPFNNLSPIKLKAT